MRRFWVLLRKELRELMTPQVLVPFALAILVFVFIGNVVGAESERMGGPGVTVVDLDQTAASTLVADQLRTGGFEVTVVPGMGTAREIAVEDPSATLVLEIPDGFETSVNARRPVRLVSYSVVRNVSFLATRDSGALHAVIASINAALSNAAIAEAIPGSDPDAIKNPISTQEHVVVAGREAGASAAEVLGFISQQTTFVPIVLFLVIVFAAQMIATTIASEKENKTLETLLASPIGRGQLVTAKMTAAALVALLSAAAYMIGLRYYMDRLTTGLGEGAVAVSPKVLEQLGLTLTTSDYAMLGATLFAGILVALAAAVIIGAFAENVRAIQSLITPLMVLIMIPYFLTTFVDLEAASSLVRWIVLAIPFSHPFMAAGNIYTGNVTTVWLGVAYQLVWFVALAWVAARIFSSDRILTLKLSGLKRRSRPPGAS